LATKKKSKREARREQKKKIIDELRKSFNEAKLVVLTDFHGMDAWDMTVMRRMIREKGGYYKVVKNTLMRVAIPGTPAEAIKDAFRGPTGIIFAYGDDLVEVAKAIREVLKKYEKIKVKASLIEGKPATPEQLDALADLPSRDELLGQLAFTLKYPVNAMAWRLQNIFQKLVTVLENVKEEKEKSA
jgi:large subunit ribosomal protein L10